MMWDLDLHLALQCRQLQQLWDNLELILVKLIQDLLKDLDLQCKNPKQCQKMLAILLRRLRRLRRQEN
jgi:hypothetical protein